MKRSLRKKSVFPFATGALALAALGFFAGNWAGNRRGPGDPGVLQLSAANADPLSGLREDERDEGVILAQRKRVMGRLRALEQIARTATQVRPLVDEALRQPAAQADLAALASAARMGVDEYRAYFAGKQEADLLLESGGDPNARSSADAIGVAQFMVGTGRRVGLKVDLARSNALSRQVYAIEKDLRAIEAAPEVWTRPAPKGAGTGAWGREQWRNYRKGQWNALTAKRRLADHRFDPRRSIFVQSRYLLRLTRRYGGVDWALQAYHGGEGGVARTVSLYARSLGGGQLASRGGTGVGRSLPYGALYRNVTPLSAPGAFGYLFGRSDDHRYYWWKVLMAERALDLYRKDAAEFQRQWNDLKPGYGAEVVYYPDHAPLQFADNNALRQAYTQQTLVPLPVNAGSFGLWTDNLAALDPGSAALHKGLRPEAMGALLRVAQIYRSHGGREPLKIVTMTESAGYRAAWNARHPEKPLPRGVPRDPEYHTTGLVFDLQRPADDWSRKVLEFSFGRLYDSLRISWRKEDRAGGRRYHVAPNPEFKAEMIEFYTRSVR